MQKWLSNLRKREDGAVFVFVAVCLLLLIVAVGIAVDLSRAQVVRSRLMSSIDAATLAAGAAPASQAHMIEEIVHNYYRANMPEDYMGLDIPETSLVITVEDEDGNVLDLDSLEPGDEVASIRTQAEGLMDTTFMKIVGRETMAIGAEAKVQRFTSNAVTLEVAMVLDNSCSMSGDVTPECDNDLSKINNLKTGVSNFVNILYEGENEDPNIKIAFIPFNQHVNQENGTDSPPSDIAAMGGGRLSDANAVVPDSLGNGHNGIYSGDPLNDTYAANGQYGDMAIYCYNDTQIVQGNQYNPPTYTQYCQSGYSPAQQEGCAVRSETGNLYDCIPKYRRSELETITSFGSTRQQLLNRVNAMQPTGYTNTALGTQYAFWALDPSSDGYFQHASSASPNDFDDEDTIKAIILMTDGANEVCSPYDEWEPLRPDAMNQECLDVVDERNERQADLCEEIKDENVVIFSVAYEVNDQIQGLTQKEIFENCATVPEFYFEADDGTALAEAFRAIAERLKTKELRLVR